MELSTDAMLSRLVCGVCRTQDNSKLYSTLNSTLLALGDRAVRVGVDAE